MNKVLAIALLMAIMTSCAVNSFYQVQTTQPDENLKVESNLMIFENDDVKVTYSFWEEGGDGSFLIYNKTDKAMFIDLGNSHLIVNGIANTYFKNRALSTTSSGSTIIGSNYTRGTATSYQSMPNSVVVNSSKEMAAEINSRSSSISYYEMRLAIIPPHSAKQIRGFLLNEQLIRNCDLYRFPTKEKNIKTITFNENNSPLIIENRISYGFDEQDQSSNKSIVNRFWVSETTNYPAKDFYYYDVPEFCDEKGQSVQYFKFIGPNKFFIRYIKPQAVEYKH